MLELPALLEAAEPFLAGRGRPLLATLAGAGLRISEALGMERRDVNIVKGTLTIRQAKTDAGVRVVDLTPALRDELAMWLDKSPHKSPTDLVFATQAGKPDNRNNVRRRLLVKAIEAANVKLVELGIEPIGRSSGRNGHEWAQTWTPSGQNPPSTRPQRCRKPRISRAF